MYRISLNFKGVTAVSDFIVLSLCMIFVVMFSQIAQAQILFEEVTGNAGISYTAPSAGASWGDFNSDGWPDIWVSNHSEETPCLYLNNTDGTFTNSIDLAIDYYDQADMHGAAWADFDNDGDQDLIQIVGGGMGVGNGPNQFFVNSGGILQNKAVEYGLDYPLGRGRAPSWFDWNGDGYLDVFLANGNRPDGQAPSALFTQQAGYFTNDNSLTGIDISGENWFVQPTNLTVWNIPTLAVHVAFRPYPYYIYQYDSLPFMDIKSALNFPSIPWNGVDVAIADFNNDLLNDFYIVQVAYPSAAVQTDSMNVKARIIASGDEKGIVFRAEGNVHFQIDPIYSINYSNIYIGSGGYNPANNAFTLSYSDDNIYGIFDHVPGVDFGIFIGYDPATSLWHLYVSTGAWVGANISINADVPITELTTVGFESSDGEQSDYLLIQTTEGFQDVTVAAGIDVPSACESAAAADFDNDMDIDIYLVCRTPVTNLPNILYENLGNNTFQAVPEAGGAEGSSLGRGDSVVTADYNRDGFMDIFVTNGNGALPFGNGPHQLFRNVSNSNHWLEVDLEGVISNRDGIGASLMATANGITQMREQRNGIHRSSQDHQRIHFGLADNTIVEQLTIQWPSDILQEINDIHADQIYQAIELDITGSPISGSAPLTVNFNSNSQGYYQPLSYEWDFDNDGIIDSNLQNPSYIFSDPGTYTVKLTITDSDGNVYTSTRTDYITICTFPVRIMSTSPIYYSTLQDAYDSALDGDTIQALSHVFTENLNINRDISVAIEGGYDCNYTTNTEETTLIGNMTISNGALDVENLVLR